MARRALRIVWVIVVLIGVGHFIGITEAVGDQAFIFLGEPNVESGLRLDFGGDVDTEIVRVGPSNAASRRTGNGASLPSPDGNTTPDWYMQFRVADSVIFQGEPTSRVRLEIEYFDEGRDQFRIQYDAIGPSGPFGDGRFTESRPIRKTDTGTFVMATLTLEDAYFGNRDNGADFRIDDAGDGAETIRRVVVTLLPEEAATESHRPPYATTLYHKVLFGYQGWFACPGDGGANRWIHWFQGDNLVASQATVDYWPDVSELGEEELFPTAMTLPDGSPAMVFSSQVEETVVRHFEWMEEYGLDGVFLQRFVGELTNRYVLDRVLENVRIGAEAYGRVFAAMYDVSGADGASLLNRIRLDWQYLVDTLKVTESPTYLHHNGLPVLAIWGLGFDHVNVAPEQAQELIDWLRSGATKYRVTLMGGVPTHWRTRTGDSRPEAGWTEVYRSFDVISPWTVGRYVDELSAWNFMNELILPDMRVAQLAGAEYMPVVWPGFSWNNLYPTDPFNAIPRDGGRFFWSQVYNAIFAGADMLYVAMFDEVDEGTAMFKLAPTRAEIPAQGAFVPLDIDGYSLPSDWYLRLGGEAGRMLRGEIPLSAGMPIEP